MSALGKMEIISVDDESTSSEADDLVEVVPEVANASRRATVKHDPNLKEKVEWTDDSDADPVEQSRGKRRAPKNASGKRPSKRNKVAADGDPQSDDELADAGVPEYVRKRRKAFEDNYRTLKEAGLRLPPDYRDVHLSEDDRLAHLEKRPQFDEASGIKPCRPYADVELEHSGGYIPASIAQYLRDYQIAGVRFLHHLFVYQKGGILGDDMGLGKTVQVAAFLTAAFGKTGDERDAKRMRAMRRVPGAWYPRVLVVCPGSLIENWKNELTRWGWWSVDVCLRSAKEDVVMTARSGLLEIMITTYQTYKTNRSLINGVEWDAVIADECHSLKDPTSENTKAMGEVNALCRIGLTGTAIQNNYEELYTLLNWTNPGRFGTMSEWKNTISRPLTIGQSHDATLKQLSLARKTAKKLVQNLLPGFFLRRMKSLIAHQLPKKTDKVVFCPLTNTQKEAYESFLASEEVTLLRTLGDPCDCGKFRDKRYPTKKGWCCYKLLPDERSWQSIVFPCIMALQKLSNHVTLMVPSSMDMTDKQDNEVRLLQMAMPEKWEDLYAKRDSMINLANPEFCGKWKILKKLLRFWHANGDKVLVFSHSVKLLRILQYLFNNTSYSVSYLDGTLSYEERQKVVDDFNSDPSQFVFLISTKAGGVGLNITSANKVVIVDPHWNPSYDLQAQDRAYRIGQTRDVDVFRLISAGTIEEIVYARQIYKQQQANIGYSASSERRYFKGVQKDEERKGEIFGLSNIFNFHADQIVLRDIVNKTNIAEAKAGINLVDVDIEQAVKDEEVAGIKREGPKDDEDGGMSQLAALITAEDKGKAFSPGGGRGDNKPKSDAVQAILASAGVEYTHENSEVVGSSKVEQQLSRRAEMVGESDSDPEGDSALFTGNEDLNAYGGGGGGRGGVGGLGGVPAYEYKPPEDVMKRQFCSMAREFGFATATEFALVVEGMTQEQRRNCLDLFYKRRAAKLIEDGLGADGLDTPGATTDAGTGRNSPAIKGEEAFKAEVVKTDVCVVKSEDFVKKEVTKTKVKADIKLENPVKYEAKEVKVEPMEMVARVAGTKSEAGRVSVFLPDDDDDEL